MRKQNGQLQQSFLSRQPDATLSRNNSRQLFYMFANALSKIIYLRVLDNEFPPQQILHRDQEIDQLIRALEPTTRGQRAEDVLTHGPSGVGKTATTRHVLCRHRSRGPLGFPGRLHHRRPRYTWESSVYKERIVATAWVDPEPPVDVGTDGISTGDRCPVLPSTVTWRRTCGRRSVPE